MNTLYRNLKVFHLLNPYLLEFHNIRMLDSSNKSHLQFSTSNNSQISSQKKIRLQVYELWLCEANQQIGNTQKTKLTSWWADLLHRSVYLASLIFFNTYLQPNKTKLQSWNLVWTYPIPINEYLKNRNTWKLWLLLLLSLVVNKNSNSKCSSPDLLHDLILIHLRLHCSRSTKTQFLKPQKNTYIIKKTNKNR